MKQWKTVLVTAVIVLLVVALALVSVKPIEPEKDIKGRTKQLKLVLEEQKLITEILQLRYDAAVIRAKFAPTQPEPAPQPALPPQIKE